MSRYLLFLFIVLGSISAFAQENSDDFFADDGFFDEDTTDAAIDTLVKGNAFFKLFKGTPGKAALLSLVVPGGGQAYNKSWWKVPIAIGIDAGAIWWLVDNQKKYKTFNEAYLGLLNDDIPDYRGVTDPAVIKNVRDNYNKRRQLAYIWLIIGHLVTVFDAFVDNHLQDFDVSDDLSFEMKGGDGYGTRLSLVVPLHTNKYKKISIP